MEQFKMKMRQFWVKTAPFRENVGIFAIRVKQLCKIIGHWMFQFRNVLLAAVVGVAAVLLAIRNSTALPEKVGLNMLESGEYALIVDRSLAIWGPLAVTAFCLLLVLVSKKVMYPWLISLFSLVLPLAIWAMNLLQ